MTTYVIQRQYGGQWYAWSPFTDKAEAEALHRATRGPAVPQRLLRLTTADVTPERS